MRNLDNLKTLKEGDPGQMFSLLKGFPQQCAEAVENAGRFDAGMKKKFGQIIISGLGGSAIGGDLLRTYLIREIDIPVLVNRHYDLSAFIGEDDLVIAVSFSGNTEETLSAYAQAKQKKASIIGLGSGGKLSQYCKEDGIAFLQIPAHFQGIPMPPRTSLGYQFFGLLGIMRSIGYLENKDEEIRETIAVLNNLQKKLNEESPLQDNLAKKIARILYKKIPIIYAHQDLNDVVALRWKDQFNENSKNFAFNNILPEMNHNEIVGWEKPQSILKNFVTIFLRDPEENPRVKKRMEITRSLIEKTSRCLEIEPEGKLLLSRLLGGIYLGDYSSAYLSVLNGVDPTPVKRIDYLKQQLK